MSSILVNPTSITALQTLRATHSALARTQREVSTGQKISTAADNPSIWAIAASMNSDKNTLSTIADSLAFATSVLDVAAASMKSAISVMNEIKTGIVQSMQPGADQQKILADLQQLGRQLTGIVASSTFAGVNLLDTSQTNPLHFVSSYENGKGADSKISYIHLPLSTLIDKLGGHFGLLEAAQGANVSNPTDFTALSGNDLSSSEINDTLTNADAAIAALAEYGSTIGVAQLRVSRQRDFMKMMGEALSAGISSFIDADMNEASTRLQALLVQQQLGVQSLSISNKSPQIILKLFQ